MMRIDKTWPLSAAEQLKSQLRMAIRTGQLRSGHALPTVRTLAVKLELNPNTIAAVYRDLGSEGLVTKHRRGGTRVAPGPYSVSPAERQLHALTDRLIRLAQGQSQSGAAVIRLIAARWDSSAYSDTYGDKTRYPLYDFLQRYEHDQS